MHTSLATSIQENETLITHTYTVKESGFINVEVLIGARSFSLVFQDAPNSTKRRASELARKLGQALLAAADQVDPPVAEDTDGPRLTLAED